MVTTRSGVEVKRNDVNPDLQGEKHEASMDAVFLAKLIKYLGEDFLGGPK
jgi:hypothetical protein